MTIPQAAKMACISRGVREIILQKKAIFYIFDKSWKINTLPRKLPEIDEKLGPPPFRDLPRRVNYRPTQLTIWQGQQVKEYVSGSGFERGKSSK